MLQIPKRLLPHTIDVEIPKDTDGFGGVYEDPVTIEHVRVEPIYGIRATDYQLQNGVTGIVFIDAVNSSPAMEVPAGSLVTLEGEKAPSNVFACNAIVDANRVHHWELELA